jgi:hypothetical protein
MSAIFISYRRNDAPDAAGRICDRLRSNFGESSVFFDIDAIPYGVDFRQHVDNVISSCDVLLVVIGNEWMQKDENGRLRLENAGDFVRAELVSALDRGIPVIPVLVEDGVIPSAADLPEDLSDFAYRNAAEVRSGSPFKGQMDRLIDEVSSVLENQGSPASADADDRSTAEEEEQTVQGSDSASATTAGDLERYTTETEFVEEAPHRSDSVSASLKASNVPAAYFAGVMTIAAALYTVGGNTVFNHMNYLLFILAAWCAVQYRTKTFKFIAIAFAISLLVSFSVLLFEDDADIGVDGFLMATLIAWGVAELSSGRSPVRLAVGQPIVLALVGIMLGLYSYIELEFLDYYLYIDFQLALLLPLLCFFVGLTGQRQAAVSAAIVVSVLVGVSEAIIFRDGVLSWGADGIEIAWKYIFANLGESLLLMFLGWTICRKYAEQDWSMSWFGSPVGLALLTVVGMLHTSFWIGDFYFGFAGSVTLSLLAMFACGWFYPKKAQYFAFTIVTAYLLIEYGPSLYESAIAQEVDLEEMIIVTQVRERLGQSFIEVLLLPVFAYLGDFFRSVTARAVRANPSAV